MQLTRTQTTTTAAQLAAEGLKAIQSPWVVLYAITLAANWFAAAARWLITVVTLGIISWVIHWSIPVNTIGMIIGFGPLVVSLLAVIYPPLIAPIDGRWWEINSGGRAPEQDEQEAFTHAIQQLQDIDPNIKEPHHWFVAEEPGHNAQAYSSSLCVDRGLLESPYAPAVIAHELGHLNTTDGRLASALNLLILAQIERPELHPLPSLPFRVLFWVASGQAVLSLTGNAWEAYWRSREFAADEYAARLGQGQALAMSLEQDALPHEQTVKRMRFSRATHPYTKPRIARLHAYPQRTQEHKQ